MSIRVLHMIPSLASGGAERQLSLLAPAMVQAGARVAVAFASGGINLPNLQDRGVELFELPARGHHDPRIVWDLRSLILQWRPDVIETWIVQMDVMGGLAALWTGVPYIISERCSAELYPDTWKNWLRKHISRGARAVIANSLGGIDYWRGLGFRGSLHLIRNGVSPPTLTPPANLHNLSLKDSPLLLAVGRLSEQKNVAVLIDALSHALEYLPDHHALILGDGPLREAAMAQIERNGRRGRIHLWGVSTEVGYWLRRADAFVSTSLFEGHPNVVIEAAAAACPLVLSNIAAHREVLDDRAALFAPPCDAFAFSACIVNTVQDRAAAGARAALASSVVAGLSIEAAAASYLEVYAELVNA